MAERTIIWVFQDPVTGDVFMTSNRNVITHAEDGRLHRAMCRVILTVAGEVVTGVNPTRITVGEDEFQPNL
jgi:hypothetical protein